MVGKIGGKAARHKYWSFIDGSDGFVTGVPDVSDKGCGSYEKTFSLWDSWRRMLKNNMTTCVETESDPRSDCHGWSSLICYELPSAILGVRPAAPGYTEVEIRPQMGIVSKAHGDVVTPRGVVHVEWDNDADGSCRLNYHLPEGMNLRV